MPETTVPICLLRLPAVLDRTGLSRSVAYRLMAEGQFPRPIRLAGSQAVASPSPEIDHWIPLNINRPSEGKETTMTQTLIAMRASAGASIVPAYPPEAWQALLAGDIDAALAFDPTYVDARTGDRLSAARARRHFRATASAGGKTTLQGKADNDDAFWRENARRGVTREENGVEVSVTPGKEADTAHQILEEIVKGA